MNREKVKMGGVMNTRRIAGELVKIAKSMVGVDAGRKRYNYDMSQNIVDAFVRVPGIDGAGVSDGFNDETTFTVTLELKPTGRESLNRRDPHSGYMDFEIPLRSIKALIIKTLRGLSLKGSWDGSPAILTPVLEGKVFTPRSVSYKDEFGNTVKGYKDKRVNFDVYMQWSRTASIGTGSVRASEPITEENIAYAPVDFADILIDDIDVDVMPMPEYKDLKDMIFIMAKKWGGMVVHWMSKHPGGKKEISVALPKGDGKKFLNYISRQWPTKPSSVKMLVASKASVKVASERDVLDGYLEAALWSSTDDDDEPFDRNYSTRDIASSSIGKAKQDIRKFLQQAGELAEVDGNDDSRIGHDLWLTRNGHGAGFWDGDYPEAGDELTKIAERMGEKYVYVGDDGKVYID